MKTTLFAAALFFLATGVSAQSVYTKVSSAGHVTFSDRADVDPLPEAATAPEDTEKSQARRPYISPRLAANVNASEAERRLAQAERKRRQGVEPQPGERTQGSGKGVLNYRYWRRQEKLRLLVEQAQHRLNATHRPQLAAR